jgi:GntR family transcriptional regulator, phosphonate transport system regulatory protein
MTTEIGGYPAAMYADPQGNIEDAIYRRIEAALVAEIARGPNKPGDRLPSESELARRFGVNRHTVRHAISGLVQRGLVRVERGRGAFLVGAAIEYGLGPRTRFSENVIRMGRTPRHDILEIAESFAPKAVAKALEIRVGRPIIRWRAVGRADGCPVSLANHYFPGERLPGFAAVLRRTRSISKSMAEAGAGEYTRAWTRIVARAPDIEEIHALDISPARTVLVTESLNLGPDGKPLDYGITAFAADRVQLVVDGR